MSRTEPSAARRGSTYVLVLALAVIVTTVGLGAIAAARVRARRSRLGEDAAEARIYAHAAVEIGRLRIKANPTWRSTYPSGVWEAERPIGSGTYTLEGIDPNDGALGDSDMHPLVLIGTGKKGLARQKMQVTLLPKVQGLACLTAALHGASTISLSKATDVVNVSGAPLSTNGQLANAGRINGDVEANTLSGMGTISGKVTVPAPPKEMPGAGVFDYYVANGTRIDVSLLPAIGGYTRIERAVLSPAWNPYGPETNSEGIYVIDCLGKNLLIRLSRIVGTLVLLNTGSGSQIAESVNWEPAVANYPALLVKGPMTFCFYSTQALSEAPPVNANYNPEHTPYEDAWDNDTADSYPSIIKGLVYVSGSAASQGWPRFDGAVVLGATLAVSENLDVTYRSTFFNSPPPGFRTPATMVLAPGSWTKRVD